MDELKQAQKGISRALDSSRLELAQRIIQAYDKRPNTQRHLLQTTDSGGRSPLHHAALTGYLPFVKYLVERGASIDARDRKDETVLHFAVRRGDLAIVQYLVGEKRADVAAKNASGATCLHIAAGQANLPVIQYLLGGDDKAATNRLIEAKDNNGGTCLHYAAMKGDVVVMKYLVEDKGANVEAKTGPDEEKTALHIAALNPGCLPVVQYLVGEQTADRQARDKRGMTPLHLAAAKGRLPTVKYLVEHHQEGKANDLDLEARDSEGKTPLHLASKYGQLAVVQYLVDSTHANVQAKDKLGDTPLDTARSSNRKSIVEFFEKVECQVCHGRFMKDQGLVCDYGHLVCDSCLQGYTDVERLVQDHGNMQCPYKSSEDDSICGSSPWTMEQVMPHLQPDIQICLVKGLVQHVRLLEEGSYIMAERLKEQEQEAAIKVMEERKRQHEAAVKGIADKLKEVEERERQQEEAAARLEEHKVQQYHKDILHSCLVKRVGPSSFYRQRRVKSVVSYLKDLSESSETKHRILESCGKDLEQLGINVNDVSSAIE